MATLTNTHPGTPSRAAKASYFGQYLGIVIQNNDPEKRGQIKVWVPHVSPTVYKNWLESKEDKKFRTIGENIGSDLTEIIDDLKEIVPWAECAAPLMGTSSSGRYNAHLKVGSISDSARVEEIQEKEDFVATKYSLNKDGIGEKPARMYECDELRLNDAFNDTEASGTNKINKYSYNYTPNSYSNAAKGSFSIPNVGAHVWIFFQNGDPMHPIYFATSFGQEDWKGIYEVDDNDEGIDYPGTYENKSTKDDSSYNHNTEIYRNKYVLNQKGGTLEIVNTDNKELLKMTHYKGSFLEFNNDTTIQLAAGNDQKLVLEDQFLTVKGFKNEWIERDYDFIVRGDFYTKIGTFPRVVMGAWKEVMDKIADYKQLFEIKRAKPYSVDNEYIQRISPYQQKSGTHAKCPVCSSDTREKYWQNDYMLTSYIQVDPSPVEGNHLSWLSKFDEANEPKSSIFTNVTSTLVYATPALPAVGTSGGFLGRTCPCCGGSLLSPSTQGGTFDIDDRKQKQVADEMKAKISELLKLEQEMGLGGSVITNISKHKIENIGLVMNDFPSIRIDPIGKINKHEVRIQPDGVVTNQKASPLIEYVHVDDLPGGSYNLNACNRFNVQVGSGGIMMKSFGPVDISGTITNITGEQINLGSDHEINIESDGRINISADILTLRQRNYKQVLVDSNLGVSQNVVIGGGMHVEGELSVQHVTAPCEVQETENISLEGWVRTGVAYACMYQLPGGEEGGAATAGAGTITFTSHPETYMAPHSHQFRNLPLTLMQETSGVRKVGSACEASAKAGATEIAHEKKVARSFDADDV